MQFSNFYEKQLIKLNTGIDPTKSRQILLNRTHVMLNRRKFAHCPAINNRKVFFDKYLTINSGYRSTRLRLASCSVGIELIRKAKNYENFKYKGRVSYELNGITNDGNIITVHIKEEIYQHKNRRLVYASSYYKKL